MKVSWFGILVFLMITWDRRLVATFLKNEVDLIVLGDSDDALAEFKKVRRVLGRQNLEGGKQLD